MEDFIGEYAGGLVWGVGLKEEGLGDVLAHGSGAHAVVMCNLMGADKIRFSENR